MTVVVGYLLSPEGDAALDVGIAEARLRGAELVVMHSSRGGDAERDDDVVAYGAAGDRIQECLEGKGIRFRLVEQVVGNAAAEDIVELALRERAELVVIGVRRRSLVGKMVLGSTAQDVIMNAPCPVLAVRVPESPPDGEVAP
jgi:nucleotide-binding universal stress UspA family protein